MLALAAGALLPLSAADETRTIRLVQDDAQVRMVTKVYPMKYVKALDIQPFVAAAVRRYTQLSSVRAQNYSAGKIQCPCPELFCRQDPVPSGHNR